MKRYFRKQKLSKPFNFIVVLLIVAVISSIALLIIEEPQALWKMIIPTSVALPSTLSATERFNTLPPGATLRGEAACASRVRQSSWEPRPDNAAANQRVPTAAQIAALTPWTTSARGIQLEPGADRIRKQITGNYKGTTDEILQWVACKWGIDEDIVRAEAVTESNWHQNQIGDNTTDQNLCPPGEGYAGAWDGSSCYQSYGILQIKSSNFQSTWPMSRDDTAFNAEYVYGLIRTCYEGWTTYLINHSTPLPGYPRYHGGDLWGCIGTYYSGNWYDQNALNYISWVKDNLAKKAWLQPGF